MKTKKSPKANLEKFSSVFSLIGLVLSLFITFLFLEHKTYAAVTPTILNPTATFSLDDNTPTMVNVIRKKKVKIEKPVEIKEPVEKIVKKFVDPTSFEKKDNNEDIPDLIIEFSDKIVGEETIDLTEIESMDDIEEIGEETIPFIAVDSAPVFPGCEKYQNNKEKSKKCFNKNMSKFFGKNFDLNVTNGLDLTGTQKISCQFIINTKGEIEPNVETSRTHPNISEEIKSVIKNLPKMIPAKQNGNPVNLIYNLPVRFTME